MSKSGIPYYVVKKGWGFWQPSKAMREYGFQSVPCGRDGARAQARARDWNLRWQEARLKGRPAPAEANAERGYVYFLLVGSRMKIGFSTNPINRLGALRVGCPDPIDKFLVVSGTRRDEKLLHHSLDAYRRTGEWFVATSPVLRAMTRAAVFGLAIPSSHGSEERTKVG
jgi:hypothetical protein